MAGTATPATALLRKDRTPHRIHTYQHDRGVDSYGDEAIRALQQVVDIDGHQVFKTLVITLDSHSLAVAVLPVPTRLSLKAAASALGGSKAAMADQSAAERSTGYVFGGIAPLGQRRSLPTVIDESALQWDRVFCSGGRRGLEIELAPADLIRLCDAVTAPIALTTA
ncbi:MAG: Cys-tRNA(Pro) deacylase [Rhodococcus sp.]|nr:Cys-tRNA(Pro) deacylase [Rhodococcus sp. (in: high G+C Gram-positive bacteria)]